MKYKPYPSDAKLYFVTSVIAGHNAIFWEDDLVMIPLRALDFYAGQGIWRIYAFCLMPNHLYALIQMRQYITIQKQMGEVHKYSGHKIIEALKAKDDKSLLTYFQSHARSRTDRKHLIWEDAIAKSILTEDYLREVVEYIHNNPCKANWRLVTDRAEYKYSSARFYDRGKESVIPVVDIREVWFDLAAT